MIDEILEKYDLTFDDLRPSERSTLLAMLDTAQNNQLTPERIISFINSLKSVVENELAKTHEAPQSWIGIIGIFIPGIAIIRKWYQDQQMVYLHARLRNLCLLSDIITRPDKARDELERSLSNLAGKIQEEHKIKGGGR